MRWLLWKLKLREYVWLKHHQWPSLDSFKLYRVYYEVETAEKVVKYGDDYRKLRAENIHYTGFLSRPNGYWARKRTLRKKYVSRLDRVPIEIRVKKGVNTKMKTTTIGFKQGVDRVEHDTSERVLALEFMPSGWVKVEICNPLNGKRERLTYYSPYEVSHIEVSGEMTGEYLER